MFSVMHTHTSDNKMKQTTWLTRLSHQIRHPLSRLAFMASALDAVHPKGKGKGKGSRLAQGH